MIIKVIQKLTKMNIFIFLFTQKCKLSKGIGNKLTFTVLKFLFFHFRFFFGHVLVYIHVGLSASVFIFKTSNFRCKYLPSTARKEAALQILYFTNIKLLWRNLVRGVTMDEVMCLFYFQLHERGKQILLRNSFAFMMMIITIMIIFNFIIIIIIIFIIIMINMI